MTFDESELIVLANMVNYPKRAFALLEALDLNKDDFSNPVHGGAFAALTAHDGHGEEDSPALLSIAVKHLAPADKPWTDAELDTFVARAPSPSQIDSVFLSFARGVARARYTREMNDINTNSDLPAEFVPEASLNALNAFQARLDAINNLPKTLGVDSLEGDVDAVKGYETPDELLHVPGFIEALTDYTCRTAPRPLRPVAFAGALALLSHLAGRKFVDARDTRPNLYLVALAPSGSGKDHPRKINKRLCMPFKNHAAICDQISTGQGFEDTLLTGPSRLCQIDEISHMLKSLKENKPGAADLVKYILTLFSESGSCHTVRKRALTPQERSLLLSGTSPRQFDAVINYPSLTFFATAVPDMFYSALSRDALTDGFLARFLIFEVGTRKERGRGNPQEAFPDCVRQTVSMLISREDDRDWIQAPRVQTVPDEDEKSVAAALDEIYRQEDIQYKKCERDNDEVGMSVWSRGCEMAAKLALLYAISENVLMPQISARGIEWAWKLVSHSAKRMLLMADSFVARDGADKNALEALAFIREFGPKGVNRSKVSYARHFSKSQMDEIEATLIDRDLIEVACGVRNTKIYRAKKTGK